MNNKDISNQNKRSQEQELLDNKINPYGMNSLEEEKERRELFFKLIKLISFVLIPILYASLFYWLFRIKEYSEWHVTLLLSLLPTSLVFLVINKLSKKESKNNDTSPKSISIDYLVNLLKEIIEAFKK